jgi:hypothetical protein
MDHNSQLRLQAKIMKLGNDMALMDRQMGMRMRRTQFLFLISSFISHHARHLTFDLLSP